MLLCPLQRPSHRSLFCSLLSPSMHCARSWMILYLSLSSPANKEQLLSVVPVVGLGLHLDPAEFQIAVMWWLGINSSTQSVCPSAPISLWILLYHAVSCQQTQFPVKNLCRCNDYMSNDPITGSYIARVYTYKNRDLYI